MRLYSARGVMKVVGTVLVAVLLAQAQPTPAWATEGQDSTAEIRQALDAQSQEGGSVSKKCRLALALAQKICQQCAEHQGGPNCAQICAIAVDVADIVCTSQ